MLYYIHGYQSSPTGDKAQLFSHTLKAYPIPYRTCKPEDIDITDCLKNIAKAIQNDPAVTLIGSSLGGFLAAATALTHPSVTTLLLLNPAIIPPNTPYPSDATIPHKMFTAMIEPRLFTKKLSAQSIIFRGTNDTVVPDSYILPFAKIQQATITFLNDNHRLSHNLTNLPHLITRFIQP
jgi:pimeloyl-ACP methyl ester carboxylesterase